MTYTIPQAKAELNLLEGLQNDSRRKKQELVTELEKLLRGMSDRDKRIADVRRELEVMKTGAQ